MTFSHVEQAKDTTGYQCFSSDLCLGDSGAATPAPALPTLACSLRHKGWSALRLFELTVFHFVCIIVCSFID